MIKKNYTSDSCPICKSEKFREIGTPKMDELSKKLVDKDYKVVRCANCSLYFVTPHISFSKEDWSLLYSSEYFPNKSNWYKNKRKQELKQRFEQAINLLKKKDYLNFLDVGCGEGFALQLANNRGWNATGIDIVDNRKTSNTNNIIKFIKGYFLEIDLPQNSFDFIYLDSVLEHVLNPKEYLEKIKLLLKEGGIAYIGVPNEDSLFNLVRKIMFFLSGKGNTSAQLKPFSSPYHVVGFNEKSLHNLVDGIGMKIVRINNFGRKFEFLGSSPLTINFWIDLFFLFPVEYLGKLVSRDVYYELYLSK